MTNVGKYSTGMDANFDFWVVQRVVHSGQSSVVNYQ